MTVPESLFDLELLDDDDPFEITDQLPHLFKHGALGVPDIVDVWRNAPLFYPATAPAHWLTDQLPHSGDPTRCRPIGCYEAPSHLIAQYMEDR